MLVGPRFTDDYQQRRRRNWVRLPRILIDICFDAFHYDGEKKPNRQLSAPTASSNYLPTDGVQYYNVSSGAFRLQSADCYKQTPPTYKHCAVCDAAVPITSDGKIDNNLFGWPNRFESIRSAESIWLIIDSVVTYYYTIHYTIHNLLNSSNKRACSNRFVNVTIVSSK